MEFGWSKNATRRWRTVSIAVISAFLASCTSNTDTAFNMSMPSLSLNDNQSPSAMEKTGSPETDTIAKQSAQTNVQSSGSLPDSGGSDSGLPAQVAYLPVSNPAEIVSPVAAPPKKNADEETRNTKNQEKRGESPIVEPANTKNTGSSAPKSDFYVTATGSNTPPVAEPRKSWLQSYFGSTPSRSREQKQVVVQPAQPRQHQPIVKASLGSGENFLPGVRKDGYFEIKRRSGIDDDSDIDLHEEEEGRSYRVASAAGLARLAPNGLLPQTDQVDVTCLKPALIRILKTIERRYGKKVLVTSGYRSPTHNQRVRGARNSQHMYCAAADIQVPGVSRWELAAFVRSLPGRGGVGTYCHTASVHIDVGPERDWNWRCRKQS